MIKNLKEAHQAALVDGKLYRKENRGEPILIDTGEDYVEEIENEFQAGGGAGFDGMESITVNGIRYVKESADPMIAGEIKNQIGHKAFYMMGAKNLIYGETDGNTYLQWKIGRNSKGVTHIKVTLNGKDLYDVEFGRVRADQYKVLNTVDDIYADQLKEIIEQNTGLYLSL